MGKNTKISEQNWELMVRVLSGNADNTESSNFQKLLTDDQFIKSEYIALSKVWNNANDLDLESVKTSKAWSNVSKRANITDNGNKIFRYLPFLLRVAAVFVAMFALWSVFNIFNVKTFEFVALNQIEAVKLPDESVVDLYNGAKLTYRSNFNKNERVVTLEGEAFFKVAHNRQIPFIINAGGSQILVTGTAFMVNIDYAGKVIVTVQSGSVEFSSNSSEIPVKLRAGQRGTFDVLTGALYGSINTDLNYDSWRTQRMVFKDTPLSEVLTIINKTYMSNLKVNIDDPDKLLLTATYESLKIADVCNILEKTFGIEILGKDVYR